VPTFVEFLPSIIISTRAVPGITTRIIRTSMVCRSKRKNMIE
jgi:hypothetical protein